MRLRFLMALTSLAACLSMAIAPAIAATTHNVYLQTIVWVSKENPAQKKTVGKFGEVYGFTPSSVTVHQGDHVVFHIRNLEGGGDDGHTFTLPAYGINKSLPPLSMNTVTFTASKAGVFPFFCEFHKPWMGGELIVLPKR